MPLKMRSFLPSLILFVIYARVGLTRAEWYFGDLDKIIAKRTASSEPEDCIKAVEEELTHAEANNLNDTLEYSVEDLRSFIALKELTNVENCNESGHETLLRCTEHLAFREWLAKTKLPELDRYQSTIVYYGQIYGDICRVPYVQTFQSKRLSVDQNLWAHIDSLTSGLFEQYCFKKEDAKDKKSKKSNDKQISKEVDSFTFNEKAMKFSSINTEAGANLIRTAMIKLGNGDPQITCLNAGLVAMMGKTFNTLTRRDKCDIEGLLERYIYNPCERFTKEFRHPLHYVQQEYNLLHRLFMKETEDKNILDMQLAAAKYRVCHLLTEVPHHGFIKHFYNILDREP